jgi:hypothetical protein
MILKLTILQYLLLFLSEWYGDTDMSRGVMSGGGYRKVLEALAAFYPVSVEIV